MLNSGSFGHIWMARGIRDQSLFILKRIRIVRACQSFDGVGEGLEALFSARREIFFGSYLRGVEGIAQFLEWISAHS